MLQTIDPIIDSRLESLDKNPFLKNEFLKT